MPGTAARLCVLALAAGLTLTACSGGDSSSSSLKESKLVDSTPAGTAPLDSVAWALPAGEPTSIDPIFAGAASEMTTVANMCENLLALQPDFSVATRAWNGCTGPPREGHDRRLGET